LHDRILYFLRAPLFINLPLQFQQVFLPVTFAGEIDSCINAFSGQEQSLNDRGRAVNGASGRRQQITTVRQTKHQTVGERL
jgi:hypothetical protein